MPDPYANAKPIVKEVRDELLKLDQQIQRMTINDSDATVAKKKQDSIAIVKEFSLATVVALEPSNADGSKPTPPIPSFTPSWMPPQEFLNLGKSLTVLAHRCLLTMAPEDLPAGVGIEDLKGRVNDLSGALSTAQGRTGP